MAEKINLKFDEDALTLGDLADFEEEAGLPLHEALKHRTVKDDDGKPVLDEKGRPVKEVQVSAKSLLCLTWIVLRAERPGFTMLDARAIKVTALDIEDDSTDAEGKDDEPSDSGDTVTG